jgi:YVTN family beta-propeller protein
LFTSDVVVNSISNMIYVSNYLKNSVQVINGTNNKIIANITAGKTPIDIEVNPITDLVYVANRDSNSISIINGKTNNVTAGLSLDVAPANGGWVKCKENGPLNKFTKIANNYTRYNLGGQVSCEAIANSGFQFSSWSGSINTSDSQGHDIQFGMMDSGKLVASFVIPSEIIPKEVLFALWALLASVLTGWLVPNISRWIIGRRQFGELRKVFMDIDALSDTEPKDVEEKSRVLEELKSIRKNVSMMLSQRKISESQYNILDKKISDYESKISKS